MARVQHVMLSRMICSRAPGAEVGPPAVVVARVALAFHVAFLAN